MQQVLALKKACLTKESILALANALKQPDVFQSLRYLDVSENYIQSEEVMLTLIDSLKYLEALEYLDLSQNFVGDTSACALAKSLKGHINITNLRLDCVQIGPVALSSLKYHLRSCEKLANLSMAENYFGQQALEFAAVLHPDGKLVFMFLFLSHIRRRMTFRNNLDRSFAKGVWLTQCFPQHPHTC